MTSQDFYALAKLEDEILELLENSDNITRGDLQSAIAVIIRKAYQLGK